MYQIVILAYIEPVHCTFYHKSLDILRTILIMTSLLVINGCQDDEHPGCDDHAVGSFQDQLDVASGHEKYDVIQAFLHSIQEDSAYIISINKTIDNSIIINAENNHHLCIHDFFIEEIAFTSDSNQVHIELNNGNDYSINYLSLWENLISNTITINPFDINPLCAQWTFEIPNPAYLTIHVLSRSGNEPDIIHSFNKKDRQDYAAILGLYENHENKVVFEFNTTYGHLLHRDTLYITTEALDIPLGTLQTNIRQSTGMSPGLNLVNERSNDPVTSPFMFDADLELRWVFDFSKHPSLSSLRYDVGIDRLQNGNWYFGDIVSDKIYEFGILGNEIRNWDLSPYSFHHTVVEKADGNFLVTVTDPDSRHLNGKLTREDFILEIDRQSGDIITIWDLKESLDEFRTSIINNLSNARVDWAHVNAIYHDTTDNTIIISARHQGVIKLTFDNEVVWILAPHHGWTTDRNGHPLKSYLLQPLDQHNRVISDTMLVQGYTDHADFEWNWGQHAVAKRGDGRLILFDNGYNRHLQQSDFYSRIVEYEIDEVNMTVKQTWTYGKELGFAGYSHIVSNVLYDEATGNYFMNSGITSQGGFMQEIDRNTREVVFDVRIHPPSGIAFHRMYRISLYPF